MVAESKKRTTPDAVIIWRGSNLLLGSYFLNLTIVVAEENYLGM